MGVIVSCLACGDEVDRAVDDDSQDTRSGARCVRCGAWFSAEVLCGADLAC